MAIDLTLLFARQHLVDTDDKADTHGPWGMARGTRG